MGRPFILDPYFKALTTLPGVGPRIAPLMERMIKGPSIIDLLWHKPVDYLDRRFSPKIAEAPPGKIATITVVIGAHTQPARRPQPYRINVRDETGAMTLVFFNPRKTWLAEQLPEGSKRVISGKVEYYQGTPQMVNPDFVPEAERATLETVEPIYPLSAGVTNKVVNKAMRGALRLIRPLPEWLDPAHKACENWPDWGDAMRTVHAPDTPAQLEPSDKARQRLAYDELLANQITLSLVRAQQKKRTGRAYTGSGELRQKLRDTLPFPLTGAQERASQEIAQDMAEAEQMLRLLQGDVGSGKTVVAALTLLQAIEAGAQGALVAPTEILARQHAQSLKPWLDTIGVRWAVLTGRDKGPDREALLQAIDNGAAQLVIGTHALFQKDVTYQNLGVAVIDEQHRFGVEQRLALAQKGDAVDMLVMTATPIPRTLALTAYGDMEVSRLDEKPPGRKPVDTRLIHADKMEGLVEALNRQVAQKQRVYWVCPLVEESELSELSAAEVRFDILAQRFPGRVGLVHGKMKPLERDAVMEKFANGDLDILVATTVIEVGVNVPEATIMVIEHAERFGLSQLHQLRGRVGRGADQSYCFLLYSGFLGDVAKARLTTMRDSEDGFFIAEQDLQLRGSGDVLGVRQSGMPVFRNADLLAHGDLLSVASDDAKLILQRDPKLETVRGKAIKHLLHVYSCKDAFTNIRSG